MSAVAASAQPASRPATTSVPIHPLLAERWSPRAFDPAHELSDRQVAALLEAARWTASSRNAQPWRIAVARRGTPAHQAIVDALMPGNRTWAPAASALLLVAARTVDDEGRRNGAAVYDTGQAVATLTVQATAEGLSVRQMGGFDHEAAARLIADDHLAPQVVVAVGRALPPTEVPEDMADREQAPRQRAPLAAMDLPLALPREA